MNWPEQRGKQDISWSADLPGENVAHAQDYLSLLFGPATAARMADQFQSAPRGTARADNICRAASMLPVNDKDPRVDDYMKRMKDGETISPVLLVYGDMCDGLPLLIADGYHRICAAYHTDTDAMIPYRIINRPEDEQ